MLKGISSKHIELYVSLVILKSVALYTNSGISKTVWVKGKYSSSTDHRWVSMVAQMVKRPGFNPWVRKIPWRRKWLLTLSFLLEKFHRQRSLKGYSPRDHKELDTTERLTLSQFMEKEMVTHSSVLAWEIPRTEEPGGYNPRGCKESDTTYQPHPHHWSRQPIRFRSFF